MRSGKDVGYGFFIALDEADAGSGGRRVERSCLCGQAQRMSKRMRNTALGGWKAVFSGISRSSGEHAAKHDLPFIIEEPVANPSQDCRGHSLRDALYRVHDALLLVGGVLLNRFGLSTRHECVFTG